MKQYINITTCFFAAFLFFTCSTGCHNYYESLLIAPSDKQAMKKIDSLRFAYRSFILRNVNEAYFMKNLQIKADHTAMTCTLDTLPPEHKLHLRNGIRNNRRYKRSDPTHRSVLNEVHFFIERDNAAKPGPYTLALNQVYRIEVIQKDRERTTGSYAIGAIGYTLGAMALVAAIVVATKSSCPFVSAYDGNQFTLQGETYGGAIYPQLARHDYLPLKMAPTPNGNLQLKISNELQERQYTDIANLLVITHNKHSRILADETGHLYSIEKPQLPVKALLNNKPINTIALKQHNDQVLQFMDDTTFTNGQNELELQFNKQAGIGNAKLVLSLKNSYWLDYLYGELAKGFGRYYSIYMKQQNKKTPDELLQWVKAQRIPLHISIKTNSGWKDITHLTTIGPVATREIVVPLPDITPTETSLTVKLSSGFMFWEIDYAAIDYTPNDQFTTNEYTPVSAIDELNRNVLPVLQKEDGLYCEQPVPGNVATLTYNYIPVQDTTQMQTFILHTKGYYTHVRHFKGGINKPFLQQFKQPDAFTAFSRQRYNQINRAQLVAFSKQ
ncbi:hypothetical protein FAM09_02365 [Niastella caeni]|uniref:Uncharacterized protein n=1 Tax=Niastella caeni TaxID=2569763 RepID=A0A4S8I3U0_9BACT|nr:hypothetical protein [Niastella caeni]THU40982.1 hypothetical protein FAM09_02365 [Niastella caeni]